MTITRRQKISVVIPTCNRASLLSRAIDSVLCQTYKKFEIIVVDDNSTDNTYSIIEKYLNKIPNFVYIKNENNIGAAASRNVGVKNSSADLVTDLDDDDEFTPDRLEYFIGNYNEKWSFLCTSLNYYYEGGLASVRSYEEIISFPDLLYANRASHAFLSKQRYLHINGQDTALNDCEDYDFWLRMTECYGPALRLPKATYIIHAHHEFERKTDSNKRLEGQFQFLEKHKKKMSAAQYKSQILQTYIVGEKPLPTKVLVKIFSPKIAWRAFKYFLQSNFKFLVKIEKKLISFKSRKIHI